MAKESSFKKAREEIQSKINALKESVEEKKSELFQKDLPIEKKKAIAKEYVSIVRALKKLEFENRKKSKFKHTFNGYNEFKTLNGKSVYSNAAKDLEDKDKNAISAEMAWSQLDGRFRISFEQMTSFLVPEKKEYFLNMCLYDLSLSRDLVGICEVAMLLEQNNPTMAAAAYMYYGLDDRQFIMDNFFKIKRDGRFYEAVEDLYKKTEGLSESERSHVAKSGLYYHNSVLAEMEASLTGESYADVLLEEHKDCMCEIAKKVAGMPKEQARVVFESKKAEWVEMFVSAKSESPVFKSYISNMDDVKTAGRFEAYEMAKMKKTAEKVFDARIVASIVSTGKALENENLTSEERTFHIGQQKINLKAHIASNPFETNEGAEKITQLSVAEHFETETEIEQVRDVRQIMKKLAKWKKELEILKQDPEGNKSKIETIESNIETYSKAIESYLEKSVTQNKENQVQSTKSQVAMSVEALTKVKDVRSVESIANNIRRKVGFQIDTFGRPAYEEFLEKAQVALSHDYSDRGPIGSSIYSRVVECVESIKQEMIERVEKFEERQKSESTEEQIQEKETVEGKKQSNQSSEKEGVEPQKDAEKKENESPEVENKESQKDAEEAEKDVQAAGEKTEELIQEEKHETSVEKTELSAEAEQSTQIVSGFVVGDVSHDGLIHEIESGINNEPLGQSLREQEIALQNQIEEEAMQMMNAFEKNENSTDIKL